MYLPYFVKRIPKKQYHPKCSTPHAMLQKFTLKHFKQQPRFKYATFFSLLCWI